MQSYFTETLNDDGLLTVALADPSGPVNRTTDRFKAELSALLDRLEAAPVRGVIFLSDRPTFGVGGDVDQIAALAATGPAGIFADSQRIKALFRRIERLGLPVVSLIEGLAVGGHFELALASHACFARDDDAIRLGFPECAVGLIPGAGGLVRCVHRLGLEASIPLIVEARLIPPARAAELGLITGLGPDRAALLAAARDWIAAHPAPHQPWDRKGHRVPGGGLFDRRDRYLSLQAKTAGLIATGGGRPCAERTALSGICEVAACGFADGEVIESRLFARQAISAEAEARIGLRLKDRSVLKRSGQALDQDLLQRLRQSLRDEAAALRARGLSAARIGKAARQAGYDPEVLDLAPDTATARPDAATLDLAEIGDRLLTAQSLPVLRDLVAGRLHSAALANSGPVNAAGFPAWTGGPLRWITARGPAAVLAQCRQWAAEASPGADHFTPPFATAAALQAALDRARDFDTEPETEQRG
ncbi:enoyl-CoA hydratase-related protein [Pseudodonghicola flavimaris]|uniref:Enoyl-CoA hydratase-related protein n=1 Tax=Pseudodonghicola flavimaris TaxID=3050036 RepID=A0ABT7F588_9RHOB|nr:enoyl-CoA hydratase-related protein [Pseudodonghicola flavimaris]MDK3019778.1 enoyl-CoA hydratase-related protein [Pseudodonghicola flavimaris]